RNNKAYKATITPTDLSTLSSEFHPFDVNEAVDKISRKELVAYINKLPEASKVVLNLFVFDGLSHKEISEKMNITEGTSKWHLNNAKNLLKKMMGNNLSTGKMYIL